MNSTHERPILFSGPMVRALLREVDPKTMTRRLTKEARWNYRADSHLESVRPGWEVRGGPASTHNDWVATFIGGGTMPGGRWLRHAIACPYGAPGDRLWIRESFEHIAHGPGFGVRVRYTADGAERVWPEPPDPAVRKDGWRPVEWRGRPSIHMPRWASRIDLEVTAIRVERLQDITEEDARAEGVEPFFKRFPSIGRDQCLATGERAADAEHRAAFAVLWDEINGEREVGGKPALWISNPWVWVVSFKRVRPA